MELNFSWKYKDYELRACPKPLVKTRIYDKNETIDFVKWRTNSDGTKYCFSLAYWRRNSEGYDLRFVGNRPFDYIEVEDLDTIWEALRMAQDVLNKWFELIYDN